MKKLSIFGVLSAGLLMLASSFTQAAAVSGQGTWETTLQGRDLDGNLATAEAYYDTALDITWLADANAAVGSDYDTVPFSSGAMNWFDANAWAAGLDPYGSGITGWRLPMTVDTGAPGCDFAYSGTDCGYNVDTATGEMASMYYDTLGNLAFLGLSNTGPFVNVQLNFYWSATEYAPDTLNAWFFFPFEGGQSYADKTIPRFAWAVHAGDVGAATVPIPAAIWLFGSSLLGLGVVARKRRR